MKNDDSSTTVEKMEPKVSLKEIDFEEVKISIPQKSNVKFKKNYLFIYEKDQNIIEIFKFSIDEASKQKATNELLKLTLLESAEKKFEKAVRININTEKYISINGQEAYEYDTHPLSSDDVNGKLVILFSPNYIFVVRCQMIAKNDYSELITAILKSIKVPRNIKREESKQQNDKASVTTASEQISNFTPVDTSDETISKIETYGDYLEMYGKIIEDYLVNFGNKLKEKGLYSENYLNQMSLMYTAPYKQAIKQYENQTKQRLANLKPSIVKFLRELRDNLREIVDSL